MVRQRGEVNEVKLKIVYMLCSTTPPVFMNLLHTDTLARPHIHFNPTPNSTYSSTHIYYPCK